MIGQWWQVAAFLLTAWLLAVVVDRCYRRNEPDGAVAGSTVPAPSPLPPTPTSPPPPRLPARESATADPLGGVLIGSGQQQS